MTFQTKTHSNCSKSYKTEYKVTVTVVFNICFVITIHKYEESNIDLSLFFNCCKLGNCVISLVRPFHMCIPLTVIVGGVRFFF